MVQRVLLKIGDDFATEVDLGSSLVDVCYLTGAPVPFGCKGGACGTCLVRVSSGGEHLPEKTPNEEILVEELADGRPDVRLACELKLLGPVHLYVFEE